MLLLCKKIRMITIIHNPRCGKSREGLAILEQSGKPFQVIKYLDKNPTEAELKSIIQKLQLAPIDLVRQKESVWIEQFKGKNLSDTEIIQAIVSNPILMERPIIMNDSQAIIGRPPHKIIDFIA